MRLPIVILAVFCFSLGTLNAQTVQGNFLLGGNIGLDVSSEKTKVGDETSDESTNFTTIAFSPNFGYFITDEFVGGLGLGIILVSSDGNSATTLNVGPFVRYYYDVEDNLSIFGHLGFDFMSVDFGEDFESQTGTSFNIGPGVAFFVSESVAIEGLLVYRNATMNQGENVNGDEVKDLSSDIIFSIGVQAYLGGN
jgi:hypothetical protein